MKKKVIGCILLVTIVPNVFLSKVNAMTEENYEDIAVERVETELNIESYSILDELETSRVGGLRYYYKRVPQRAWTTTVDTLGKVVDTATNVISKFTDRDAGISIHPKYNLSGYGYTTSGSLVRETQKLLVLNGYSVDQDGYWGPKTCSAVKNFQSQRGLVADGIVGYNTWTALFGK